MNRPLHRRALSRLLLRGSAYDMIPPYDYVQNVVERYLADYLGLDRKAVRELIIVGGYKGDEIPTLLRSYPKCAVTVYEPSSRYKTLISDRFGSNPRVKIRHVAVSDTQGSANFYETNKRGSGSILKVGSLAKDSYGMEQAEQFTVDTITLDSEISAARSIDCVWIDVQGAELFVLRGARESLKRIKSIFVEVSRLSELYEGGAIMDDIEALLALHGFKLALLGLDRGNLTGNAFFVRRDGK